MEWRRAQYLLTDDASRVDVATVHRLLSDTYWAVRRPLPVVEAMLRHSLCFSLLAGTDQVGFARAVSDYTVFSWLADLVIAPDHRGRGLGKWVMSCVMQHPDLARTQFVLQTRDAHALYERFSFTRNGALMSTSVEGL